MGVHKKSNVFKIGHFFRFINIKYLGIFKDILLIKSKFYLVKTYFRIRRFTLEAKTEKSISDLSYTHFSVCNLHYILGLRELQYCEFHYSEEILQ